MTFRRILVIVALGALVGAGWAAIGHSAWAAGLDAGTAGRQFSHAIEPLRMISGWLLVAVPSVLLIRTGWAWFDARVLGHEPRRRIDPSTLIDPSTRVVRGE